jgi:hypothetical protein
MLRHDSVEQARACVVLKQDIGELERKFAAIEALQMPKPAPQTVAASSPIAKADIARLGSFEERISSHDSVLRLHATQVCVCMCVYVMLGYNKLISYAVFYAA